MLQPGPVAGPNRGKARAGARAGLTRGPIGQVAEVLGAATEDPLAVAVTHSVMVMAPALASRLTMDPKHGGEARRRTGIGHRAAWQARARGEGAVHGAAEVLASTAVPLGQATAALSLLLVVVVEWCAGVETC